MYYGIEYWAFEICDQEIHPALNLLRRAAFKKGTARSGNRAHVHVAANKDFLIATYPMADRVGTRDDCATALASSPNSAA